MRTGDDRGPELVASDIPFSATGLSRSIVVDPADAETLKLTLHEAVTALERMTTKYLRAAAVIAAQRNDFRARRGR
jgi:hypothetical protein